MIRKIWNRLFVPPRWHNARSLRPVSRVFGLDRGVPIDRYYIEHFLASHREAVTGRVLEVAERSYTNKFGTGVNTSDVLHVDKSNRSATIIGDLTKPDSLPRDLFDCFICTQTFNFIFDMTAAVRGAHQLLKPGGTLLATVAGISQISRYDMDRWGDYWRFTSKSAHELFSSAFGASGVSVESFGNVLAAVSFLEGLAAHELSPEELDTVDDDYQLLIGIVARKG